MRHPAVALVLLCLIPTGCSRQAEGPMETAQVAPAVTWEPVVVTDMTETQKAQRELIVAATNALAAETLGELEAALAQSGGPGGILVCREKAPEIASHVSSQFGIAIGRTSHRLRNPANLPPDWAQPYVADRVSEPVFLAGPSGELGALLPIRLRPECQMCHGPVETIDEEVLAAINEIYPDDRAVGFTEGDLRGWFWAEAPPGEPEASS